MFDSPTRGGVLARGDLKRQSLAVHQTYALIPPSLMKKKINIFHNSHATTDSQGALSIGHPVLDSARVINTVEPPRVPEVYKVWTYNDIKSDIVYMCIHVYVHQTSAVNL